MKLKAKFSLSAGLLVAIVVAGVSVFIFIAEKRLLITEMKESQINTLKALAEVSKEFLITKNRILLLNYIDQIKETRAMLSAQLISTSGEILGHTDINLLGKIQDDFVSREALKSRELFIQNFTRYGEDISDFSIPVIIGDERRAVARVQFSRTSLNKWIEKNLREMKLRIFGISIGMLIFGVIGALVLAHKMTGPIKKMAEGAALIGEGKLDTVIEVKSGDELGDLSRDLNKMAEKLKELDQMKQDFVSSVTHELRSPLNSLGMYFDLFFQGSLGELTDEQKESLTFMKDSTSRLTIFINDLLDVAKIERGMMEVNPELFDLSSIISDAVRLYKIQADKKQIELKAVIPPQLPSVFADPDRTSQVFNNLINNAVKFTSEGGKIIIEVKCRGNDFVEVSVSDTGMGIPKDQLSSVFNKFEQVKGVRSKIKGQKGTGLGLSIVKGIVESQGGNIWVESEIEKGSTFYFTLPIKKSEK